MKLSTLILFLMVFVLTLGLIAIADEPEREYLSLKKAIYPENDPYVIDGGFYTHVSIMDCHNVILKNADIIGGIGLNDSYPEIGLKNITIENCFIHDSGTTKPIFMGGSNIEGIFILNNKIGRTYDSTHGIYLSGGHWKPEWPPIRNIVIKGNTIGLGPAGRNGIQCNGRFLGGDISDNYIFCFEMNGINLIGCQNFKVSGNIIAGNNRGCIGIYNYIDSSYFNVFDEKEMDRWLGCHFENTNIVFNDNILVVGPHQFHKNKWHNNDPTKGYPVIFIKDNCPGDVDKAMYYLRKDEEAFKEFLIKHSQNPEKPEEYELWIAEYLFELKEKYKMPTGFILGYGNTIWTPNPCIIQAQDVTDVDNLYFMHNQLWSTSTKQMYGDFQQQMADITGNSIIEPTFDLPEYPFIDMIKYPNYDWKTFVFKFNPEVKKKPKPSTLGEVKGTK